MYNGGTITEEKRMLKELVRASRSYRRFDEDHALEDATLRELVELTRYVPSAANRQPLKYIPCRDPAVNERIFPCLAWAGYLQDWDGPAKGERPTGYIIVLSDNDISKNTHCDQGIAAQTIMLGAAERGLGGCIIASVQRDRLRRLLAIPTRYEIVLVLALGKPVEKVVLEEIGPGGDIQYWRDKGGVHHVPKRKLGDILLHE